MTLGYAILIVFVLWLIDKHNLWRFWRQVLKVCAALILLAALGYAGLYGWAEYSEYKEKQERKAADAAFHAELDACNQRIGAVTTKRWAFVACSADRFAPASKYENMPTDAWVELDGSVNIPPPPGFIPAPPEGAVPVRPIPKPKPVVPVLAHAVVKGYQASIYRKCHFSEGDERFRCSDPFGVATLKQGDTVDVLSDVVRAADGHEIYEVRFREWSGWIDSMDLKIEPLEAK
jgi:hypothetical protein